MRIGIVSVSYLPRLGGAVTQTLLWHQHFKQGGHQVEVFCPGCLAVQGSIYSDDPEQASRLAREESFGRWPLVVLHDDANVAKSTIDFLWATWTRFEPAADIYAAETKVVRHHLAYRGPIVIDARIKPGFPEELVVREDIGKLVDRRWAEYFPNGLQT